MASAGYHGGYGHGGYSHAITHHYDNQRAHYGYGVRTNRSERNCASATVHELAVIGNASVDPCHDFSHYACFDHALMARSDVRREEFFKAVVNPTLQGTLKSQASVLLSHMYTSCMKRMANNPVTPESASLAFLEAVRSWGVGQNGSVNVASIAATMDIRYCMKMGMEHEITLVDSAAKLALMTIKALDPRDIYVPGVDNDIFYNRSLLALSGALGHTVTVDDVRALVAEVRRQSAGKNGTKHGNYSLLAEIYRTPLLDTMMTTLCDCNEYVAVEVHGADAIVAQLDVFGRQQLRATVLAYLSLWASVDVLGAEINATYAGGHGAEHSTTDKMRYCVENVMRFKHVWDIIAVEELRTKEKDRALRRTTREIWRRPGLTGRSSSTRTSASPLASSSLPPAVYSELRLECGSEALFLNAHLVGIHLVDGLVQRLCLRGESEGHSEVVPVASLGRLCVGDPRRLTDVLYPQLALRVVGRALMTGELWHHDTFTWGDVEDEREPALLPALLRAGGLRPRGTPESGSAGRERPAYDGVRGLPQGLRLSVRWQAPDSNACRLEMTKAGIEAFSSDDLQLFC
ncbi:hypothetical protein MTO96_048913 [Rhipicephalus appendiculatus]